MNMILIEYATLLQNINFERTTKQDDADCYILNTCHIRDKAKEKVYHEVGRIRKTIQKQKTSYGSCRLCCSSRE